MAHLSDSFASRGISAQAFRVTPLMIEKQNQQQLATTLSLFSKWGSWFEQNVRDPTVEPLEDIAS